MHTRSKELIDEAIAIIGKYGAKEYAMKTEEKIMLKAWKGIEKNLIRRQLRRDWPNWSTS